LIDGARTDLESRVLILGPSPKDAQTTRAVLQEVGILSFVCPTADKLIEELDRGAAAAIIAQEAILRGGYEPLKEILDRQLPWSDLPLVVVSPTMDEPAAAAQAIEALGNVSLLERPVRIPALISAVRTALRARTRQYQIRAHIRDREIAAEALKAADRRKDEFLAVLAHELRNPLAPIRNALSIMRLTGPEAALATGMGEMLERQVNHMIRLVDDLFEVSRITRGSVELRIEPVDLADVLRHAVETSRPLIDDSRQSLVVTVDEEPMWIVGDPIRLAQVFANLLNNASKFSSEGGAIHLTAGRRLETIEVTVKDSGAGISPEMLPRVFEMFAQGKRSARKPGGLGIGLTLAKSLVELHGGSLIARSEGPGRGSEFVVTLPFAKVAAHAEDPSSRAAARGGLTPCRVLVVDDNRDAADSVALLLKLLGADVRMTYDGPGALAAIETFRPAIVLLDIGLPGMDGYEVARRIRQRSDLDHVTLIALTGWGQAEDRLRSQEAGFQHHLVKPADPAALEALLATIGSEGS
jgi:signal transduction histidine kinase